MTDIKGNKIPPLKNSFLTEALPEERNAVTNDAFDRAAFEDMVEKAGALADTIKEGKKSLKTFDPLSQDIFDSLYKYRVDVRNESEMMPSHRINHTLINKAMETDQYEQLRNYTKLDNVNAAMATITIAEKLKPIIEDELKEAADLANEMVDFENQLIAASRDKDSLQSILKSPDGIDAATYKKLTSRMNKAKKAEKKAAGSLEQAAQAQQQCMQGSGSKIKQAMRAATAEALEDMEDTAGLLASWGRSAGHEQQLSADERMQMARTIRDNKKIKAIARTLGRFKRLAAHAQANKIEHGQEEIYDIGIGNDLQRVIPSELGLLTNPLTTLEFKHRFAEGKLLQYKLRGTEDAGMGPIVCCLDSSGSIGFEEDVWQKAVALSLLDIAQSQKRAFACILFGSRHDPLEIIRVTKNDPQLLKKAIHLAEYYLGGGTDFEKPLDAAMAIIEEDDFKKADIVFCTDGMCNCDEDWMEDFISRKKAKNVRIQSILVDVRNYNDTSVEQFSDTVTPVSNLASNQATDEIHGIFGAV
jgi:uncharacterized protein with von Willebrand factor type A (vWA) domain